MGVSAKREFTSQGRVRQAVTLRGRHAETLVANELGDDNARIRDVAAPVPETEALVLTHRGRGACSLLGFLPTEDERLPGEQIGAML